MAKHNVHCRVCRQIFDTNSLVEGSEWIMPINKMYYHTSCYQNWIHAKGDILASGDDEFWYMCLKDYLAKDLKMEVNYKKLRGQFQNYIDSNTKNAKGVYFAVKYHFDICHGDISKANGGIGIVSSIYDDARAYWQHNYLRVKEICANLEKQSEERIAWENSTKIVKQTQRKANSKTLISLDEIALMEDEND